MMDHRLDEEADAVRESTQFAPTQHNISVSPDTTATYMRHVAAQQDQMPEPQAKVRDNWGELFTLAEKDDIAQCDVWRDEVNNILIFAALFSGVVTSFLLEAYRRLEPDQNQIVVALLTRLVLQSGSPPDVTLPSPIQSSPFKPTSPSVRVSIFWTISVVLALGASLIGIVSLQWLREHRAYPEEWSMEEKFTALQMRTRMLKEWRISAVFVSLPFIIMLALMLFFLGLVDFLISLEIASVTISTIVFIAPFILFLIFTTIVPTFPTLTYGSQTDPSRTKVPVPSPFKSPQAKIFRLAFHFIVGLYASPIAIASRIQSAFVMIVNSQPMALPDLLKHLRAASEWPHVDSKWLQIRRICSFYNIVKDGAKPNAFRSLPERFPGDYHFGPIQDQLDGLMDISDRESSQEETHELVFQCFQRSIPLKDPYSNDPEFKQYLEGVLGILETRKRSYPPFRALVSSHRPESGALYDMILLQFANHIQLPFKTSASREPLTQWFLRLCDPTNYGLFEQRTTASIVVGAGIRFTHDEYPIQPSDAVPEAQPLVPLDFKLPGQFPSPPPPPPPQSDECFRHFVSTMRMGLTLSSSLQVLLQEEESLTTLVKNFIREEKMFDQAVQLIILLRMVLKAFVDSERYNLLPLGAVLRWSVFASSLCRGMLVLPSEGEEKAKFLEDVIQDRRWSIARLQDWYQTADLVKSVYRDIISPEPPGSWKFELKEIVAICDTTEGEFKKRLEKTREYLVEGQKIVQQKLVRLNLMNEKRRLQNEAYGNECEFLSHPSG
ncbi:unnamed protein product [Cyclocybe aegerita]|uniref:DUF6535 domain-containing protein n=1 Tax=Cyclocybe aegerita TaxID=1973307 RepID=A0A8S0WPX8_CYCAE|nr:unnamed protein product [Cyclocybe aegerita]